MRKVVISGMIGNGLEWYDYALYGQMAWLLSKLFFPAGDPTVQLLATYGVFAAGFIIRPVGGVLFGWIGDTYGRKAAMVIAVLMMAIPTGCIGLLPTYAEIGIWAPLLLTLIRLLQGMSLGGEFSGSITYIVEHAPPHRRGVAGAASLVSLNMGFLLGLFVTQVCMYFFGSETFEAWGWRLPFVMGVVIGLIGFYIRTHCAESPVYAEARAEGHLSASPLKEAIRQHPWEILQGFCVYITVTMPFYLVAIYFISFSYKQLGLTTSEALWLNVINMLVMMLVYLPAASLSDRIGRRPVMLGAAFTMFLITYPLFSYFVPGASFATIGLAQVLFTAVLGIYLGPVAVLLVELFPTSVRASGMAISYNFSAALFGGTSPFVCEWLIAQTGSNASIAWYVIACTIPSMIALYFYQDRHQEPLRTIS
jgi:MHS family proline/betaine transporter-like MFS transporter